MAETTYSFIDTLWSDSEMIASVLTRVTALDSGNKHAVKKLIEAHKPFGWLVKSIDHDIPELVMVRKSAKGTLTRVYALKVKGRKTCETCGAVRPTKRAGCAECAKWTEDATEDVDLDSYVDQVED